MVELRDHMEVISLLGLISHLLIVATLVVLSSCDFMTHTRCEDKLQHEQPSPDGKFVAVINSRHCANDTGLYTWVGLKDSDSESPEIITVLTIRGIHEIAAVWKSPTQLDIDLPQNLNQDVLTQKESWQTVTITHSLKHDGTREPPRKEG